MQLNMLQIIFPYNCMTCNSSKIKYKIPKGILKDIISKRKLSLASCEFNASRIMSIDVN